MPESMVWLSAGRAALAGLPGGAPCADGASVGALDDDGETFEADGGGGSLCSIASRPQVVVK